MSDTTTNKPPPNQKHTNAYAGQLRMYAGGVEIRTASGRGILNWKEITDNFGLIRTAYRNLARTLGEQP